MAFIETKDELSALKGRLQTKWASRDELIREMRELRYQEREPDVPVAYEAERVKTPIAYQMVERIVGTLTADRPQIIVPPASQTERAAEQASELEKGTLAILDEIARQQGEDPLERFIECLIADGHGCMRMLYAPQIWKGMPRKKKSESDRDYVKGIEEWKRGRKIPVNWQWVDPLNVYPVFSEMGLAYVLEIDRRDIATINPAKWSVVKDAPELNELVRNSDSGEDDGLVEFMQLWTEDELIYAVNGEIVHQTKHRYGRAPYVYAYGISPSTTDRKYRGLSVLFPLRNILPYLDRLMSQKATAIRIWAWPTPVVRLRSNQALLGQLSNGQVEVETGVPRTIEIRPGQLIELFEDEELTFLTWTGNGPDADEMIAIIQGMIQKAGLSDVMYGQASSGDSGYLVNQLIAAARMKLKPIITHAEFAAEHIVQVLWDIVENQIKQPLYAFQQEGKVTGWIPLDPDDMNGYRQVRVKVNPLLPTDKYAQSSRAINEYKAGLRDQRSAMEEIGIDQPDEMQVRILVDEFKREPAIRQILVGEAAKRLGVRLQEQQAPDMQMSPDALMQAMPGLPPGLQQAIMAGMMGQQGQGGAQVMAAPGVQANPGAPQPPAGALIGHQGPVVQPAGIAGGMAPGPRLMGPGR